ncbi:MAG TPA: hypothetical protein VD999_02400 [Vitreimonas sp.]|nr:hypothetical protein [Vitreimonas sp.]
MLTLLAKTADFGKGITPAADNFNITKFGDSAVGRETALKNLELFVSQILGFLTVLAALFFIVYFVMGAFKWTAAGGDSGKVGKARDQMIQGVMGLIIIVAAYGVMGLIGRIVGIDVLSPGQSLLDIINNR